MPYGEARTEPMRRVCRAGRQELNRGGGYAARGGKNRTEAAGMPYGEARTEPRRRVCRAGRQEPNRGGGYVVRGGNKTLTGDKIKCQQQMF